MLSGQQQRGDYSVNQVMSAVILLHGEGNWVKGGWKNLCEVKRRSDRGWRVNRTTTNLRRKPSRSCTEGEKPCLRLDGLTEKLPRCF
jgi:hypothetical protein